MDNETTFFDFAAEVGLTKHIGGLEATQTIVELCHIGAGTVVLDVGCGVGVTAVLLARQHGCRVVGVDIRPRMVERATERAAKTGLQALPFDDETFVAVIGESVTAFPEDKLRADQAFVFGQAVGFPDE